MDAVWQFESLCKGNHLTDESVYKLVANGFTSISLLKLLTREHIQETFTDWTRAQTLALEALVDKLDTNEDSRPQQTTRQAWNAGHRGTTDYPTGHPIPPNTMPTDAMLRDQVREKLVSFLGETSPDNLSRILIFLAGQDTEYSWSCLKALLDSDRAFEKYARSLINMQDLEDDAGLRHQVREKVISILEGSPEDLSQVMFLLCERDQASEYYWNVLTALRDNDRAFAKFARDLAAMQRPENRSMAIVRSSSTDVTDTITRVKLGVISGSIGGGLFAGPFGAAVGGIVGGVIAI